VKPLSPTPPPSFFPPSSSQATPASSFSSATTTPTPSGVFRATHSGSGSISPALHKSLSRVVAGRSNTTTSITTTTTNNNNNTNSHSTIVGKSGGGSESNYNPKVSSGAALTPAQRAEAAVCAKRSFVASNSS
jgi:hypothetical protein